MPKYELLATEEVENAIRRQAELSGIPEMTENLRKALALRHALWEASLLGENPTVTVRFKDGSEQTVPLI